MKGVLIGLFVIALGVAVIYWHRDLYKMFGDVERAQKAFGDSLVLYPLIGTALIVIGILFMFGVGMSPENIDSSLGVQ